MRRRAQALTALPLLTAILFLMQPSPAQAACNGLAGCSCTVTATGISFGNYNPLSPTATDATGTINVHCDLLVALAGSYTIDISAGSSGSFAPRTLRRGATALNYNLYTNAARTQIWGNGTGGSVNVTRTVLALLVFNDSVTVYGRIPAGQNVAAGAGYLDTLTVTVTY
ncbi:spore coat U domain-containing protein [Sphingobium sp. SA916]|uniref:Csu type fimbrial protein n=1 Tax=Sphingobium sp. SA916 TaxID=1851207 RepID=UPI000C9F6D06|nr:spore coat U domain-containing protein [Sphingobium sp. SA916]PNQ03130.1 pilus assembly protein [Sphingobium sp. SA916]